MSAVSCAAFAAAAEQAASGDCTLLERLLAAFDRDCEQTDRQAAALNAEIEARRPHTEALLRRSEQVRRRLARFC